MTVALEVRCSIQLSYGRMGPSLLDGEGGLQCGLARESLEQERHGRGALLRNLDSPSSGHHLPVHFEEGLN